MTAAPSRGEDPRPLVYPEPLFTPTLVDGTAFLYFERKLTLTLAPAPVMAAGGFEIVEWVRERRPSWAPKFLALDELWGQESDGCVATFRLLEPIRDRFTTALVAVPGDQGALERAGELIRSAGFDAERMRAVVDPVVAAGELMNHIYLEMWLLLENDSEALYHYVGELLADDDRLESTMQQAYMLRIAHLAAGAPVDPLLLNSPRLAPFLLSLWGDASQDDVTPSTSFVIGQASWEFFRQILRPYLDPLDERAVELIAECLADRFDEVQALKLQTERLAERITTADTHDQLSVLVADHIRLHVADDIADLLRLDERAKQRFLDSLLSDRGAWVAALAAAHGATMGSAEWTMGGAIGAIAMLGSKGYATIADRRRQLASSDYRLIYSLTC
jgi:hypothetical protein